jgi:5-methylcytosine-specific restriction endonuclease McrA
MCMPKGIYARTKSGTPRAIARQQGQKTYIGGACMHCGKTTRYVANGNCFDYWKHQGYSSQTADYRHEYYVTNKEPILAAQKVYRRDPKNRPGILRATKKCQKRRQVRDAKAEGSHTKQEWEDLKTFHGHVCLCCGKHESECGRLERDHIIPVIKGGTHWISNIQPLCKICNSRKGTRTTDFRSPR